MATHDYVLDNASGAAFRTDLNNALAAIVSNNSNSSSPATTYAYQWWADTTSGILKLRNSSNNAWIDMLNLDGTFVFDLEDGSASAPSLRFADDLDTGIFSAAANTFNVATSGTERMELSASSTIFNEDGLDVDFRIEGDSEANLFYLDAGNDRIGIGLSTPQVLLHLNGTNARMQFTDSSTGSASGDGVLVGLNGDDDFFINNRESSKHILFFTEGVERVRVSNGGGVLFHQSASGTPGFSNTTTGAAIEKVSGSCLFVSRDDLFCCHLNRNSTGTILQFAKSGSQVGSVTTDGSDVAYNTGSSDRSLKKNFETWNENTLNLFKNLKPQKFNFISEDDTDTKHKGYIAQDLVDSFPEAYPKDNSDKYMFNPSGMVVYLMKALQEEIVKREALETRIAALEAA